MKRVEDGNKRFEGLVLKNKKEYDKFIQFALRYADEICMTVEPYLDNIEEFKESKWGCLADSIIEIEYERDSQGFVSSLIYFKIDYRTIEFFKSKKGIFDFEEVDPKTNLILWNPIFIKNSKIFCSTLTHEHWLDIVEGLYDKK